LLSNARQQGVTLNDLLVYTLFLVLAKHQEPPSKEPFPWLRVCVPTSFRPAGPDPLSAINQVSLAFLNRRSLDIKADRQFLQGIHQEMSKIKRHKLGIAFLLGLVVGRRKIGGMLSLCRARRCQATAVLSNPGRIYETSPLKNDQGKIALGSATLESIDFLTPVRPKTSIALATLSYAGQLQLTLHYDPFTLNASQSQALLDDFAKSLHETIRPFS
jgi:hypothetical protein